MPRPPSAKRKDKPVSFKLSAETKAALERMAQDDERSISSLLVKIITDHLRKRRYLE